jgi:RHS repeat-associated protein
VVARYSDGLNIDEPLAMLRSATASYYDADGLGSVSSLSNAAGALANTYTYDSYGKTTSTGSIVNPFQYTAREFDAEAGLYFNRARYYNPQTGRFLSEDPSEFDGGDGDFYRYSYDDPTNMSDPYGLQSTTTAPPPVTAPAPPFAPKPIPPTAVPEPSGGLPILGPIIGAIPLLFTPMPAGPECLDVYGTANCPDKPPPVQTKTRPISATKSTNVIKNTVQTTSGVQSSMELAETAHFGAGTTAGEGCLLQGRWILGNGISKRLWICAHFLTRFPT